MKQRSLVPWLLALFGIGILGSLFFYIVGSNDHEGHSFTRDNHRFTSFNNGMMRYPEHSGFHHNFEFLPVLFVLFILLAIVWLGYRRFKNQHSISVNEASFLEDPISPSHYNNADFLDNWEKNTKALEEQEDNGHPSKN